MGSAMRGLHTDTERTEPTRRTRERILAIVGLIVFVIVPFASAQDAPTQGQPNPSMQEGRGHGPAVENPDSDHRLVVIVRTRNNNGKVYCALWRGPEGYPRSRTSSVGEARDTTIEDRQAVCIFNGVEPGEHAVAVFHDENANNDLDTNLLGIPSEGTGASNGEHNLFGPPRYPNARFMIPDVATHRITIPIYY